ncbi:hypothetical protein PR048_021451 [Dryococelus australis]|uniref:TUG ubiquitin-like domain-containing protein n=1 Tax=Dryococelus australis TaxID=614101 RepID=A0ABQ9GY80_9NEOP|nr:hypothetical protein PR048_021451 [Dryococelus australis]
MVPVSTCPIFSTGSNHSAQLSSTKHLVSLAVLVKAYLHYKGDFNNIEITRHHREVLDTTTTLQFSGLPNNALLEMVPIRRVRVESSVTLGLQLESGNRLTGTFLPSDTLWTVVMKLCPEEEDKSAKGDNPVVIYMRQEISGVEGLKGVTLRHLGLTGGRAMLR